jgi:hypothetical protein
MLAYDITIRIQKAQIMIFGFTHTLKPSFDSSKRYKLDTLTIVPDLLDSDKIRGSFTFKKQGLTSSIRTKIEELQCTGKDPCRDATSVMMRCIHPERLVPRFNVVLYQMQ